ncbi:oligosaccharide flippase family protein [Rhizobium oryziradicis]|uniref:Multi antimicrobial extrusion protein MatE n=1 Tax=Rhizobium oryziradicis TaxID=1867956 RepID=A0A1Q8ZLZ5_9HYPH|nr:lipopolysaccharide biosynthesis protein [Rhizobium oryziradicis]OLP42888.1 multi antimicrobial extrusion protein MatE [Rhizobium oryziradicis]
MALVQMVERHLPSRLAGPARKLFHALIEDDDVARAQRMALVAFAIRIVSAAIAFFSQIIQARLMGDFEYGIFVFVWVLVVLFGNLSCLGFHSTIIRFLPQYQGRGEIEPILGLTLTARLVAIGIASLLAVVGLTVLHVGGERIAAYYITPLFLGLFALPMIALGDVLDGTARANSWAVVALSPTYIIRPLLILGLMLGFVGLGQPRVATTAMQAALVATYITTLGQFLTVSWRMRNKFPKSPRRIDFWVWFRVAVPIFFIEGFLFLLTNSDVVVVGLYLPPDQVGIYFAAAKTMAMVQFVYFAVKAAAGPRFSALMNADDIRPLAAFSGKMARWCFWPSLCIGLIVLAAGKLLLGLFGHNFTAGYPLMAILFAGILTKALIGPGEVLLTMAGRQNLCVLLYLIALIANIGLNVTLIPLYGLVGAAMATALATLVEALLLHIAVRRALGIVLFAFADPLSRLKGHDRG